MSDGGEEGEDLGEKGKRVPMLEVSPGSFKPKGIGSSFEKRKQGNDLFPDSLLVETASWLFFCGT